MKTVFKDQFEFIRYLDMLGGRSSEYYVKREEKDFSYGSLSLGERNKRTSKTWYNKSRQASLGPQVMKLLHGSRKC
jgi:hypothetical protein